MMPENVERAVNDLVIVYGQGVKTAADGPRRLVRLNEVELYPTCRPTSTNMLLVFDPAQSKPQVFVTPGQLLANGRVPKNSSNVLIGGETWMQFSFNIPWTEADPIIRFVAAARQRFIQGE